MTGRAAPAHFVVDDASLSRRHAEFELIDGAVQVTDLGSTNGTFVNGRRPAPFERVSIAPGDRVALGAIELQLGRG